MKLGALALLSFAFITSAVAGTVCTPSQRELAPGVRYEQLCRNTGEGEPWSIHVLRASRDARIRIHAIAGHTEAGQMTRELPTAMANRDIARGHHVLAVVNGDFDFIKPESNFGISVGLSVVEGRLWTGDQSSRPVLAFTKNNQPLIGIPKLRLRVRSNNHEAIIAAYNKPPAANTTAIFTGQFRSALQLPTPAGALFAENARFDSPLPLYKNRKARVANQLVDATQLNLSANSLALVPNPFAAAKTIQLRLDGTVDGHRIRDAVGGFPIIVREGHSSSESAEVTGNLAIRHPRTAVCYNRDTVIFTVVDGRQPSLSELAALMIDLGCDVAMNTDGGGSSVMAIADGGNVHIVNSPSDGHERGRGNAWVIETR